MKKHFILTTAALLVIVFAGMSMAQYQQRGPGDKLQRAMMQKQKQNKFEMLNLSDAQKEQIENLRTEHLKTVLPLRNQLGELKAELQTLTTSETTNMNAINQKIDELGSLKTQMMKAKAAHRQQVRSLLTEEQRVKFDAHSGRQGRQKGKMHRQHRD